MLGKYQVAILKYTNQVEAGRKEVHLRDLLSMKMFIIEDLLNASDSK
jgi:hypothetical protein